MNRLFIYGDFDWLESPLLIGELGYESLRGSDSYSFKFGKEWLAKYGNICWLRKQVSLLPRQE
jgi:serine/threonine-protein kinase HipA